MKIAVYAITKNEEQHVDRFLGAILPELREGDGVYIADTGSTDQTRAKIILAHLGHLHYVIVNDITISPWRFDDARNASLALVPADVDVCVCLDLDEVLQPGWREAIERAWTPDAHRLRYKFIWSWQDDGTPGVTYYADKIHRRHGGRWRLPCHEMLYFGEEEKHVWTEELVIHHHPDSSKSRGSYDHLMELSIKENPGNDRVQHYYARQLYYQGRMPEAAEAFKRHLANPKATWPDERSQSMLYLAWSGGNDAWKTQWFMRAAAEAPHRREVWYELAKWMRDKGEYHLALAFAQKAASLPRSSVYMSDPEAQGDGPQELLERILMVTDREEEHG